MPWPLFVLAASPMRSKPTGRAVSIRSTGGDPGGRDEALSVSDNNPTTPVSSVTNI
jgi:hypothetical protein